MPSRDRFPNTRDSFSARWDRWLPPIVAVAACALGTWLRLRHAGTAFLWGDEFHSLALWRQDLGRVLATYDPTGSGLALPLLQRGLAELVGPTLWAVRGPAIAGGLAVLLLLFPLGRPLVGATAAALGTLALAVNPVHVFYSYYARSYGLAVLLGLLLVHFSRRTLTGTGRRLDVVGLVLCVALLPWVHLTGTALVIAAGCAAALGAAMRREWSAGALTVGGAYVVGLLLCLVLYLPAWDSFTDFITAKAGKSALVAFGPDHVADLLSGGRAAGIAALCLVPVAAVWALAKRTRRAVWIVVPALLPGAILLLVNPLTGPYSFSRYLLVSLPFLALLLAWAFEAALRSSVARGRAAGPIVLGGGVLLLMTCFVTGPIGPSRLTLDRFAATYLAMRPLEVFDVPSSTTPPLYRTIAATEGVERVVEVPPPAGVWGLILYRNYALQHGKDVLLGTLGRSRSKLRIEPVVHLTKRNLACVTGAEWVVLHEDLGAEARRYRREVFQGDWEQRLGTAERPFVESFFWTAPEPLIDSSRLGEQLRRQLGEPAYADGTITAWSLEETCREGGAE
jgi:hypothetical protein